MKRTPRASRHSDGERGATAIIVALSLVALLGLVVLTVDVGQLLFKRRAMVNASDAAALAAAQSCAGLDDADIPQTVATTFAQQNVSVATGGITQMVGCDGPAFGHVSVEYTMNQGLFFGGVVGASGPATVRTVATAGWGPTGGGNPVPIVVYEGSGQGDCAILENIQPNEVCYLWYDNDSFQQSAFGFLNLCTVTDSCQAGWGVGASDQCPAVGASLRSEWISGSWTGGPNETNYPASTFVCRVSGLASSDWAQLEARMQSLLGNELLFPVNDCTTMVDRNGTPIGCDATVAPDKYNIIGFIVLRLDGVYTSPAEWGGTPYSTCDENNVQFRQNEVVALSSLTQGQCPKGAIPTGVENLTIDGQPPGTTYTYDATNQTVTWLAADARRDVHFNWWVNGQCGRPPQNSSAVCIKVTTVSARFRGTAICESCKDFGTRAVRLCDLRIGSCPRDRS